MAHPGLTPLPPAIHHSSTPLSHRAAHTILSSFLALAELDPSLRPDSVLSERGPTSSSSAANPSLALAHLGRIKLGIEGKRSQTATGDAPGYDETATPEFWDSGRPGGGGVKRKRISDNEAPSEGKKARGTSKQAVQTVVDGHDAGELALVSTATAQDGDGWQDRENYDLAQDDDDVDVGNALRSAGAGVEGVEETVGTEGRDGGIVVASAVEAQRPDREDGHAMDDEGDVAHKRGSSKVDKAERKRLKKEKSKKEKKTARSR